MNSLNLTMTLFRKNAWAVLKFIIALIISLIILGGIIKLFQYFIPSIETSTAALIAFSGTVLAALIKNYFDRATQIESEKRKEK